MSDVFLRNRHSVLFPIPLLYLTVIVEWFAKEEYVK